MDGFSDATALSAVMYLLMGVALLWHMFWRTFGSYASLLIVNALGCIYFAVVQSDHDLHFAFTAFVFSIIAVIPLTSLLGWKSRS